MVRRKAKPVLEECPHCGARFRAGRAACPECGSDAVTGWRESEDIDYLSVEIPDTYEELVQGRPPRHWLTAVVLVFLILAFFMVFVLGRS